MKSEKYIRELKSSFQVRIKYEDSKGVRKDYTKTFKFKDYKSKNECLKAAMKHRDEMLYKIETAGIDRNADITLAEVYEESKELFPKASETHRKHDLLFQPVLDEYGSTPMKSITAKDITYTLNNIRMKSQDNINRLFSIWRIVYRTAIVSDYIMQDMTMKVIVPKSEFIYVPKSVVMECTLDDVLKALRNYGVTPATIYDCTILSYAMIIIAYLGLRPSECYALTKDDFNFKNKTVSINKAVGSTHTEKHTIRRTKTQQSVRIMPLPDDLLPILKKLFKFQKGNQLFVFADGSIVESQKATALISSACKKANIKFNPYMLRHAFSTNLMQAGYDVRTIMELMGHQSTSMTVSYARSNDELKRDAISALGDKIGDKK